MKIVKILKDIEVKNEYFFIRLGMCLFTLQGNFINSYYLINLHMVDLANIIGE